MIDFSRRSGDTEIMDDLEYAGEMMDRTLGELEVINRWLGGNRVTINGISKLLEGNKTATNCQGGRPWLRTRRHAAID